MSDLSRILLLVDVQWGNLAEWLQALGATGALVVALVLLSKQLSAHRASEEDRRQAPARSVAAWHEHDHGETSLMFVRNAGETPASLSLVLR
jgi:hypothetical protein